MAESDMNKLSSSGPLFRASEIERGLEDALEDLQPGSMPEVGGLIGGKYRVERLIACGGMGAVFEATHKISGKRVAVKWMLPTLGQIKGARERFIREACATARIAHPNIVDIYDVGSESGSVYLVMEFLRGETLAQRLARGTLSDQQAITLLLPALRGVATAHMHDVIHRDLKPDNIFLCRNEEGEELEPKVLDFGISKITTDEVRDLAITHSGAVLGTPYYMSPEQVRGAGEVDARTDVYAFGVMLFEALTGRWPFDAETYNDLIVKIATEPTPRACDRNPNVQPEVSAAIERAMARDPDARFPNIEGLALALEPFAGGARFRIIRTPIESLAIPAPPPIGAANTGSGVSKRSVPPPLPLSVPVPVPVPALTTHPLSGAPPPSGRATAIVAAVVLALCIGAGALMLHRQSGDVSIAGGLSQPSTRAATPQPSAAVTASPPRVETSLNAAQDVAATVANQNPEPRIVPTKPARRPAPLRDKRLGVDAPPPPEVLGNKRLPKDWDDRISTDAPRLSRSVELPAGRIDSQDFR